MQATSDPSAPYCAYRFGSRGHIEAVTVIDATSEAEAVRKARQIADGYAVELWHRDRFIVRFQPGLR